MRVIVSLQEASASSVVTFVKGHPPTVVVTASRARFEAPLAVRGTGRTCLHAISMLFFDAAGALVHRAEISPGRDLLNGMSGTGFFAVVEANAALPKGVAKSLRVLELHERIEQVQPLSLAWQFPVTHAPERGAWSLESPRNVHARGPKFLELTVSAIDDGLEARVAFAAAAPGWRYAPYELALLATTSDGAELEAASAAVIPGETSAVVLPLPAQTRARVGMFDLRLGGTRHHDGMFARFDLTAM